MSEELAMFLDSLDRFGPDLAHWPNGSRERGRALLERGHAGAMSALARAEQIEALLRSALAVPAPPQLAGRILAGVQARRGAPAWKSWLAALLPHDLVRAGAVAAALLVVSGAVVGALQQAEPDEDTGAIVALLSPADLGADGD